MEISRGNLQLQIAPYRIFITPQIIQALSPTKSLDPKVLSLANGQAAFFLSEQTSPLEFIKLLTSYVAVITLVNKYYYRSPKPLAQLFTKELTLSTMSCCPALTVKLALYMIRGDARIKMNDRKERALYIISTIALGALMTPHFLKIHRKTYEFYPMGVAQYTLAQIVVYIAVAEIFDWNDRCIAEEIEPLSSQWTKSLMKYQDIGPQTKAIVDQKIDRTQTEINEALAGKVDWKPWMDTAPIKEDQITLPSVPDGKFATFVQNHPKLLQKLPFGDQIGWNLVFDLREKALIFSVPFPREQIQDIDGNLIPLFHKYFTTTPFFFLLSEADRQTLNQVFAQYHPKVEIKEASLEDCADIEEESQMSLKKISRMNLDSFSIELQHQFYENETEHTPSEYKWSSLSLLEKWGANEAFKIEGLKPLPLF